MKFYECGTKEKPVLLLIPGTVCHHSMFDHVIPYLENDFLIIKVSFDGFDETENTEYPSMREEVIQIENYIRDHFEGRIACAYGCSLGGSFVADIAARERIHMDHAIIGSSDMDTSSAFSAKLKAKIVTPLLWKIVNEGLPSWMAKINEKKMQKHPESREYREKFTSLFTTDILHGHVTKRSVYNQFYYDLITPKQEQIDVRDTVIHVFYAEKMGKQYEERYRKYFKNPDIRRHPYEHEELLVCHPEEWAQEVKACCSL